MKKAILLKMIRINIKKIVFFIILFSVIFSCKKEDFDPDNLSLEEAKNELPLYYNFLNYLVNEGYEFWDYHEYCKADTNNLPEKLIVIRHDIHEWDLEEVYYAYVIENRG